MTAFQADNPLDIYKSTIRVYLNQNIMESKEGRLSIVENRFWNWRQPPGMSLNIAKQTFDSLVDGIKSIDATSVPSDAKLARQFFNSLCVFDYRDFIERTILDSERGIKNFPITVQEVVNAADAWKRVHETMSSFAAAPKISNQSAAYSVDATDNAVQFSKSRRQKCYNCNKYEESQSKKNSSVESKNIAEFDKKKKKKNKKKSAESETVNPCSG